MNAPDAQLGGKAAALRHLQRVGFPVPRWFAVLPQDEPADTVERLLGTLSGDLFAVRSSAAGEDSAGHSFAGQFDTFLFVPREAILEKIAAVRRSGQSERVLEYRRQNNLQGPPPVPGVIVQEMIDADCAGVAFSADPVSGRRDVAIVSGVWGLGSALVSGEADADSFTVERSGAISQRSIANKLQAHRAASHASEGVLPEPVELGKQNVSSLADADIVRIAELARQAQAHFGCPQDIEWAMRQGRLWLLQSRPITSLAHLPDPADDLCLWDNSNISESYSGVTTPLTFSFARRAYENVYREFCRLLSVPTDTVERSDRVYANMLGLIRGRIYYNLLNWYRVLAMLPGFQLNRTFMEQMMGVKEPLPEELVQRVLAENQASGKMQEWGRLLRCLAALVRKQWGLPKQIRGFYDRLATALAPPAVPLPEMRLEELTQHYGDLESQLLRRWDAPLVNDFFAMIFFGVLRSLCTKWLGDADGTLANTLVQDTGEIISIEPLHRIQEMAALARLEPDLLAALQTAERPADLAVWPAFAEKLAGYLEKFGDRCLEELKLESKTVQDDPRLLFASIAAVAARPDRPRPIAVEEPASVPKPKGWLRGVVFRWVLRQARDRVRDRENLRFERTRLFGRVRRIFMEAGRRLSADGILDAPTDIFYLDLTEILGLTTASTVPEALRGIVAARQATFAKFRVDTAPPERFQTRGPQHRHAEFESSAQSAPPPTGPQRKGLGCCAGVIRGRVRVVLDPAHARLEQGEILVARQTDPGWVMLFPMAFGLLVERGSLLSHSAIVAREMGLPAVVGIPDLCQWLQTGEEVEFDGKTGVVTRIG